MSAARKPQLARIQAKLDRWELDHLRQHAAELAQRLEAAESATRRAEDEARRAEDTADFWREQALAVELRDDESLGITQAGHLVVVETSNRAETTARTH